jgi:hypothetical protein
MKPRNNFAPTSGSEAAPGGGADYAAEWRQGTPVPASPEVQQYAAAAEAVDAAVGTSESSQGRESFLGRNLRRVADFLARRAAKADQGAINRAEQLEKAKAKTGQVLRQVGNNALAVAEFTIGAGVLAGQAVAGGARAAGNKIVAGAEAVGQATADFRRGAESVLASDETVRQDLTEAGFVTADSSGRMRNADNGQFVSDEFSRDAYRAALSGGEASQAFSQGEALGEFIENVKFRLAEIKAASIKRRAERRIRWAKKLDSAKQFAANQAERVSQWGRQKAGQVGSMAMRAGRAVAESSRQFASDIQTGVVEQIDDIRAVGADAMGALHARRAAGAAGRETARDVYQKLREEQKLG